MGDTQYESEALRYAPWHRRLESFSTTPISHQICPMVSCGWLSLICNAKYRHMPLVVIASVCRFLCPVMPYRVRQKPADVLLGAQVGQSGSCLELKKKSDQLVRGVDIFSRSRIGMNPTALDTFRGGVRLFLGGSLMAFALCPYPTKWRQQRPTLKPPCLPRRVSTKLWRVHQKCRGNASSPRESLSG